MSAWVGTGEKKRDAAVPRPSASVVLVSPKNQILLLHRVKAASSFPSAHVFPGGNVDHKQDGTLPPPSDYARHEDGPTYRLAAIRECFEESGLLLAKTSSNQLLSISDEERNSARRQVHDQKVNFSSWLKERGGAPDVDGLHAFTRFVTPTSVPKRFSTQMYIYFLPLEDDVTAALPIGERQAMIPVPTSDGGVEHTAAQFLWPSQWLGMAKRNEIIVYPPQVYLLTLISDFFREGVFSRNELEQQRQKCREFLQTGDPVWADKVMSPDVVNFDKVNKKSVIGLYKPGPELEGSGRCGDPDRVISLRNTKEGPRDVEVRWKKELMAELRAAKPNM